MYFRNDEQLLMLQQVFNDLTGDPGFFRSIIFTCSSDQAGHDREYLETLNWYMDPTELDSIRRNMSFETDQGRVGRDRNDLRVRSLVKWWSARGGKIRVALPPRPGEPEDSSGG
jgi:hypothetical protein